MLANNDLKRIETTLLESMINAYSADNGRLQSPAELLDRNRTIAWLKSELKSRNKAAFKLLPEPNEAM